MAVELVGASVLPHVAIVCGLAYLLTGHRSIYPAQRLLGGKGGTRLSRVMALRDLPAEPSPSSPPKEETPEAGGPRSEVS
jgi:hypothetical protein